MASIEPADWKRLSRVLPESADIELTSHARTNNTTKIMLCTSLSQWKKKAIVKLSPTTSDQMIEHLMPINDLRFFIVVNTLATEDGAMSGKGLRQYSSEMNQYRSLYEFECRNHCCGIQTMDDVRYYQRLSGYIF